MGDWEGRTFFLELRSPEAPLLLQACATRDELVHLYDPKGTSEFPNYVVFMQSGFPKTVIRGRDSRMAAIDKSNE